MNIFIFSSLTFSVGCSIDPLYKMLQIPPRRIVSSMHFCLFPYLNDSMISTGIAFFVGQRRRVKSTFTPPSQKDPVLLYEAFANVLIAVSLSDVLLPKETMN